MSDTQKLLLMFISSQEWAIDSTFGFQMLNQALYEATLPTDILKKIYSQRRKESSPQLLTQITLEKETIVESDSLSNWSEIPKNSILKLQLSGVMTVQDQVCSNNGIQTLSKNLYNAYSNANIKGIIIETLSGGGESTAGYMLNSAIADANKPVIQFAHISASAAVHGTLRASERWASSISAQIGSIGCLMTLDKSLLENYQNQVIEIYAEGSPNKNKEFRSALSGDYTGLQKSVDTAANMFMKSVKKALPLKGDKEKMKETVSGGMFYAQEALDRGLIDGIGGLKRIMERINTYK